MCKKDIPDFPYLVDTNDPNQPLVFTCPDTDRIKDKPASTTSSFNRLL